MANYPKFEKVDKHTIKVIVEQGNDVTINQLLDNKEKLEVQKEIIEKKLEYIEKVLDEAKKLKISPAPNKVKENKKK